MKCSYTKENQNWCGRLEKNEASIEAGTEDTFETLDETKQMMVVSVFPCQDFIAKLQKKSGKKIQILVSI